jgi:hypothetical protein
MSNLKENNGKSRIRSYRYVQHNLTRSSIFFCRGTGVREKTFMYENFFLFKNNRLC